MSACSAVEAKLAALLSSVSATVVKRPLREWLLKEAVVAAATACLAAPAAGAGIGGVPEACSACAVIDGYEDVLIKYGHDHKKATGEDIRRRLVDGGHRELAKEWVSLRNGRRACAHPHRELLDKIHGALSCAADPPTCCSTGASGDEGYHSDSASGSGDGLSGSLQELARVKQELALVKEEAFAHSQRADEAEGMLLVERARVAECQELLSSAEGRLQECQAVADSLCDELMATRAVAWGFSQELQHIEAKVVSDCITELIGEKKGGALPSFHEDSAVREVVSPADGEEVLAEASSGANQESEGEIEYAAKSSGLSFGVGAEKISSCSSSPGPAPLDEDMMYLRAKRMVEVLNTREFAFNPIDDEAVSALAGFGDYWASQLVDEMIAMKAKIRNPSGFIKAAARRAGLGPPAW
ncbi:unnamed protein product [Prorocentrum cordatum]|uniref:Uncharacterized protein n=1 Tax=Prorocentrum cordatum TaxID=2364126 RepID=A0ABN9PNP8_9DINO|nr:unnamed protein product [Polarella glacialis]